MVLTLLKFEKGMLSVSKLCYYEGEYMPVEKCLLPITDFIFQRGVGTFEAIRVYDGHPFGLKAHLERFANSIESAGIATDKINIAEVEKIIRDGLKRDDCPKNCSAKPYATGGDVNSPKGHFPNPRLIVVFEPVVAAKTESEVKNGIALLPNRMYRPNPLVKSINYLFGLIPLGKSDGSFFESLYISPDGEIAEGMTSNFYLVKGNKIITAPVGKVLKGVTRGIVLTLAKENGFEIEERCPRESELAEADEAFITGSVKEVVPVVRVGDTQIGNGKPGTVAKKIQDIFTANLSRWFD